MRVNPLTAKLFNWNFHSHEVVSRWRDPQLQVSENYSDLTKWRLNQEDPGRGPTPSKHETMLGQRRRRWTNIVCQRLVFAGMFY